MTSTDHEPAADPGGRFVASGGWWGIVLPLVAALPAAIAAARAIGDGWVPLSDDAVIATRAHDVLSARTPVLGQMSTVTFGAGASARSPGPLPYWLFALTSRVGPMWLSAVAAAGWASAAIVASVRLAHRRGGLPLMAATAVGFVFCARAFDPVNLAEVWNPSIGLAPMVLLFFLCWSVAVGERRLLPVAVVVASVVGQAHLTYLLAGVSALVVAVGVAYGPDAVARVRRRSEPRAAPSWWPLAVAAGVGGLAWALPLGQQIAGDTGNITLLFRAADSETHGWGLAGRVLGWAIGVVPAFTRAPGRESIFDRLPDAVASVPGITALLVLAGLAALVGWAIRHRRRDVGVPAGLVLALAAAAAFVARSTPTDVRGLSLVYTTWWMVSLGYLAWLVLVLGVVRVVRARRGDAPVALPPALAHGALAVVAVAAVTVAALTPSHDREAHVFEPAGRMGDVVAARVEPGRHYLVQVDGLLAVQMGAGLGYRVRRAGAEPVVAGTDGRNMGRWYEPTGARCDGGVIRLVGDPTGPVAPGPGEEALVTVTVPPGDAVDDRFVTVLLGPDEGEPSC
ncbi:MAG TPA: hypothetical protein VFU19_16050 [Iamia sp.]|nr:hypothetical protein [Iamia sp.]